MKTAIAYSFLVAGIILAATFHPILAFVCFVVTIMIANSMESARG